MNLPIISDYCTNLSWFCVPFHRTEDALNYADFPSIRSSFREVTCALKPKTHVSSRCQGEFTSQNWYLILLLGESLLSMCQLSEGIFRSSDQVALHLTALTNLFVKVFYHPTFSYLPLNKSGSSSHFLWHTPHF